MRVLAGRQKGHRAHVPHAVRSSKGDWIGLRCQSDDPLGRHGGGRRATKNQKNQNSHLFEKAAKGSHIA